MKKTSYILSILVFGFIAIVISCKKPYNPTVVSSANSYLVVEGVINSGNDSTFIKLSKTVNIAGDTKLNYVNGATVTVEDEQGDSYPLQAAAKGLYVTAPLHLDATKKYRIHILTDNKDYASDYVEVKQTPPIDSIGYALKSDGMQIYANAHDASNNTRYYRWEYTETWRFQTRFPSDYIYDKQLDSIRARKLEEQAYFCFASDTSASIVIGSTAKLANDVVAQAPITTITSSSEKIGLRYSIKIKQYALTKEAYQFWENLKKNTEQLGSIFDAQPTQLTGNIHNTNDATEPVIGYISASNVQAKRVFIDRTELPKDWRLRYPYDCNIIPDTALYFDPLTQLNTVKGYIVEGGNIPIQAIYPKGGNTIIGFTYSTPQCVDCRIRGRNVAPSFWIEK